MIPARQVDRPHPGLFAIRLAKHAVEVGARITYAPSIDPDTGEPMTDRSWYFAAEINGEPDPDPAPTPNARVWRIWHSGRPIEQREFDYLIVHRKWARENSPTHPAATPREAVDFNRSAILF